MRYSYLTLLGTDDYVIGTLCLSAPLKRVKSNYPLLVMYSQEVSESVCLLLKREGCALKALKTKITCVGVNKTEKLHVGIKHLINYMLFLLRNTIIIVDKYCAKNTWVKSIHCAYNKKRGNFQLLQCAKIAKI